MTNVESKRLIHYNNGVHWPHDLVVDTSMTFKLVVKLDATIHVRYAYLSYSVFLIRQLCLSGLCIGVDARMETICFKCIHHSKISSQ